jgi:hypothetical protein
VLLASEDESEVVPVQSQSTATVFVLRFKVPETSASASDPLQPLGSGQQSFAAAEANPGLGPISFPSGSR